MVKTQSADGTVILFQETPYYFKITIGIKTWYWRSDTGAFDGVSFEVNGV